MPWDTSRLTCIPWTHCFETKLPTFLASSSPCGLKRDDDLVIDAECLRFHQ